MANVRRRRFIFNRGKLVDFAQTRNCKIEQFLLSAGFSLAQIVQINRNAATLPMVVALKEVGIENPLDYLEEELELRPLPKGTEETNG